jgi:hypothetical protein
MTSHTCKGYSTSTRSRRRPTVYMTVGVTIRGTVRIEKVSPADSVVRRASDTVDGGCSVIEMGKHAGRAIGSVSCQDRVAPNAVYGRRDDGVRWRRNPQKCQANNRRKTQTVFHHSTPHPQRPSLGDGRRICIIDT